MSPDLTGSSVRVEIESERESLREDYASAYSALYFSTFGCGAFFDRNSTILSVSVAKHARIDLEIDL